MQPSVTIVSQSARVVRLELGRGRYYRLTKVQPSSLKGGSPEHRLNSPIYLSPPDILSSKGVIELGILFVRKWRGFNGVWYSAMYEWVPNRVGALFLLKSPVRVLDSNRSRDGQTIALQFSSSLRVWNPPRLHSSPFSPTIGLAFVVKNAGFVTFVVVVCKLL
ncbi:hypothetical protein BD779DRAFT_663102 [Infundibulicybe gibba]|nr:hypothetical protein BD779DRAFT_663102 [Infundibulicybe gibba]